MLADVTVLNQFGFVLVTASLQTRHCAYFAGPSPFGFFPRDQLVARQSSTLLKNNLVDSAGFESEGEDEEGGMFDDDVFP